MVAYTVYKRFKTNTETLVLEGGVLYIEIDSHVYCRGKYIPYWNCKKVGFGGDLMDSCKR